MIILWGLPTDSPIVAVRNAVSRLGHSVTFLDQREVSDVSLSVDDQVRGNVSTSDGVSNGMTIDLEDVTAAYVRPYNARSLLEPEPSDQGTAWNKALLVTDILLSWADITSALVVNRPSAMASNGSKPFQAEIIQLSGFEIPDTLVTTDRGAVIDFVEQHGRVVYKSISGVRSIVSGLTQEKLSRLDDIAWCPTQFQEYIGGRDYRVHVVGAEIFACEIISVAEDYRYAALEGKEVQIKSCDLPKDVAERCLELSQEMHLQVSGIDLRRSASGEWYCFEVNPSPAFSYYQDATGQAIDHAVAQLLINGMT
jgi:ribosomal protein S6-L-glutamate ligase RimK-like protein